MPIRGFHVCYEQVLSTSVIEQPHLSSQSMLLKELNILLCVRCHRRIWRVKITIVGVEVTQLFLARHGIREFHPAHPALEDLVSYNSLDRKGQSAADQAFF